MVKRISLVLLVFVLLISSLGCGKANPESVTAEPADSGAAVLQARRDAAESYMRKMATFVWRAEEDIFYTRTNNVLTDEDFANYTGSDYIYLKKGRLYRGIPYSYAGTSALNFYDYASAPDAAGISTVSGLHWRALNGDAKIGACVGNDCSSSIQLAWDSIGSDIMQANTKAMTKLYGYLPVGEYQSVDGQYADTRSLCSQNGTDVMHKAYTGLQKADAVVKREPSWGHTMMVVENHVIRKADGSIDGQQSYVTVLHQTSSYVKKETKEFDPQYNEDVYTIYGVDDKYTYDDLFDQGYLPVTCDVFVDPAPVKEVYVKDSEKEHSYETILNGMVVSNRFLSAVTVTITDQSGKTVMEGTCYALRQIGNNIFSIELDRFLTDMPEQMRGYVNPEELAPGEYHCTHVVRDAHGELYTMRDFDFTVS